MLVLTDSGNSVGEVDESNNLASSASKITVSLAPVADLVVTSASATPAIIQPGQSLSLQWTIKNEGAASTTSTWSDFVYLSTDGTVNNATLLAIVPRTESLAPDQSVSVEAEAVVPTLADGTYQVLVVADAYNEIEERSGEDNNTTLAGNTHR